MNTFLSVITVLYGVGGVVTLFGFVPTIRDLSNGKPSANSMTYVVWTLTTLMASIYGFFILKNLVFNIVINLQVVACLIVLTLRIHLALHGKR